MQALNKEGRSLEVREEQRRAVHTSSEYGQAENVPGLELRPGIQSKSRGEVYFKG